MTIRGYLALAASLALVAVLSSTAQAHTTISAPAGSPLPYQQWVDEAKVPTPVTVLVIREEPCALPTLYPIETGACTAEGRQTIWFEWWMPAWARKSAFYHEMGHNFDYLMPEWARLRYLALLDRPIDDEWRSGSTTSPNEQFAESYAACAVRPHMNRPGGVAGEDVIGGWRIHNRVCLLIGTANRYMPGTEDQQGK